MKITCAFKQSQGLILVKSEFGFASEQNQSMILVKSGCQVWLFPLRSQSYKLLFCRLLAGPAIKTIRVSVKHGF